MIYKTVIFDLDGTLLDTLQDLHNSVNAALTAYGLPCRSIDEVRKFIGNGIAKLIERAIGVKNYPDFEGVLSAFKTHYGAHCKEKTQPYDGILELLKTLQVTNIYYCDYLSNLNNKNVYNAVLARFNKNIKDNKMNIGIAINGM